MSTASRPSVGEALRQPTALTVQTSRSGPTNLKSLAQALSPLHARMPVVHEREVLRVAATLIGQSAATTSFGGVDRRGFRKHCWWPDDDGRLHPRGGR